jgi:hypothetical protein
VDVKHVRAGDLTISAGTVRVLDNSTATGVSVVSALSIASGAKLDLRNNKLIARTASAGTWNGTSYTGVSALIAAGRNGNTLPLWDGTTGIITSMTDATASDHTSIGVARASDIGINTTALWAGQTVSSSDTLVMYTYGGDANLDGKINILDYVRIDQGLAAGLSGWSNGDFNYDGVINILDYAQIIDSNIANQSGTFFTGGGMGQKSVAAVPEPGGAAALVLCMAGIAARRRRRNI